MEVCHHIKSEEDILASASFADRQLEYDTLKSLQLKVIMSFFAGRDVFAILPTGYGKSLCYALLPLLFDRLYRLQGDCCSCFLKRNFHPDRACYLATGLPVESGTSFLRSLDDFEMSFSTANAVNSFWSSHCFMLNAVKGDGIHRMR